MASQGHVIEQRHSLRAKARQAADIALMAPRRIYPAVAGKNGTFLTRRRVLTRLVPLVALPLADIYVPCAGDHRAVRSRWCLYR